MPYLFPFLRDHTVGNIPSLLLAAAVGGVYALLVGMPLMRLSGLAAGIATFAVLEITHNILRYWTKIGPGSDDVLVGARDDRICCRRRSARCSSIGVAFGYQRAASAACCGRRARMLRLRGRRRSPCTGSG